MNDVLRKKIKNQIDDLRKIRNSVREAHISEMTAHANLEASSPGHASLDKMERAGTRLDHAVDCIDDAIEMLEDASD